MKSALVIGSEGQVGKALCEYLTLQNYEVRKLDILNSASQDLRSIDPDYFASVLNDVDFAYFLAFDVGGSHYLAAYQDSFSFIENNSLLMVNTFNALNRNKTPYIFASSTLADVPKSTYGVLKALGERYALASGGLPVKFWNVYGRENDPEKFHVISDFIKMAKEERRIKMRTDGSEERDFLYAEDCSRGLEAIMLNFDRIPRDTVLNLASFKWSSIREVADIVAEKFGAEVIPGAAVDTVHHGVKTQPNPYLLKYWQPTVTLRQGIHKIIEEGPI